MRIASAVIVKMIVATPTPNTIECMFSGSSKLDCCPAGGSIAGMLSRLKADMAPACRVVAVPILQWNPDFTVSNAHPSRALGPDVHVPSRLTARC